MKLDRNFGILFTTGVLALSLVGCGGSSSSSSSSDKAAQEQETKTVEEEAPAEDQAAEQKAAEEATSEEGADQDQAEQPSIAVTIDNATTGTDYDGNPVVIVTYTFTNVSDDEAVSYMTECIEDVYQNGVGCETAFVTDLEGNSMTKVKAGASNTFQKAYKVTDRSPVEIEVRELFSFDKTVLATQTFEFE